MARKQKEKLGLDDFNFDDLSDFDSLDSGFDGDGIKDDRKAVTKVAGSVKDGALLKVKDRNFQRRILKDLLPEGYSRTMDFADQGADSIRGLYDTAAREIRPAMRDIARASRRMMPNKPKYMPEALYKKLQAMGLDDSSGTASVQNQQDADVAMMLGSVFTEQAKQQANKEMREEVNKTAEKIIDKKRFETQAQMLAGIRDNTQRQVAYQDSVNVAYQKKSLEIQLRHYFTSKKLLGVSQQHFEKTAVMIEGVMKNTALPDYLKIKKTEAAGQIMRDRWLGAITEKPSEFLDGIGRRTMENLTKTVQGKARDYGTLIRDALEMAGTAGGDEMGPSKSELAGELVGGELIERLIGKATGPMRRKLAQNDKVSTGGNVLSYLMNSKEGLFSQWAKTESKGPLAFIMNAIKESVPGYDRGDTLQSSMMEDLDKAALFDNQVKKSITDVIPGFLGKIHRELRVIQTGDTTLSPLMYSWDSGKFETAATVTARARERIFDENTISDTRDKLDAVLEAIDPEDTLSKGAQAALKKMMLKKASQGEVFDPRNYVDYLYYNGVDQAYVGELVDHFKSYLGYNEKHKNRFGFNFDITNQTAGRANRISSQFAKLSENIPNARDELLRYAQAGQLGSLSGLGILNNDASGYSLNYDAYVDQLLGGGYGPNAGPSAPDGAGGGFMGPPVMPRGPAPIPPSGGGGAPQRRADSAAVGRMDDLFDRLADRLENAILNGSSKEENQEALMWYEEIVSILQSGVFFDGEPGEGIRGRLKGMGGKLGKGLKRFGNFAGKKLDQVKGILKRGAGIGGSIGGALLNTGKELWESAQKKVTDVYVRGQASIALKARLMRAGEYIDVNTGKVIKSVQDITGEVRDRAGEVVITAEDFANGLYGSDWKLLMKRPLGFFQGVAEKVKDAIGAKFKTLTKVGRFAFDVITRVKDIYVPGESSPRIHAHLMRKGLYFDKDTFDVIRKYSDIKGDVVDNNGDVVLTADELAAGVVDAEGKPIKTLTQKAQGWIDAGTGKVKDLFGKAMGAGKWAKDKITGAASAMWGKAGDLWGKMFGDSSGEGGFSLFGGGGKKLINVVTDIRDILLERLPKPKGGSKFDTDGDGFREGSWQDQKADKANKASAGQRLKEKLVGAKDKAKAKAGKAGGMLKDALGGLADKFGGGLGGILGGALGGATLKGVAGKAMSGLGTILKSPLSKLGALVPSMGAIASGASAVAGAAGTVLAGIGSIISAPVVIGAAVIGGLAVGGYFLYKHLTTDRTSLTRLRLIQYGIDVGDEDQAKAIAALEKYLDPAVQVAAGGKAQIKSGVDAKPLLDIFGIDAEEEDEVKQWAVWFHGRFKPIYLTYHTALKNIDATGKLNEIDKKLTPAQKKKFIGLVRFPYTGDTPLNVMASPWPDEDLEWDDAEDVYEEWQDAKEAIDELKEQKTEGTSKDKSKDNAKRKADALAKKQEQSEKEKAKAESDSMTDASWWKKMVTGVGKTALDYIPGVAAGKKIWDLAKSGFDKVKRTFYDSESGEWLWPTMGRISSMFGPRNDPGGSGRRMHSGVDIAAAEGTPVRACAAGVIQARNWSDSYGKLVYIKHDDGKVSRYAHMSRWEPGQKVGDRVEKGQIIGYVGNTGRSFGNHLHFEIRDGNNKPIDPTKVIKNRDAKQAVKDAEKEVQAAKSGKDDSGYPDDPADSMEGKDTIASTATNKSEADRMKETAKAKAAAGVDASADQRALAQKEKAQKAAAQTSAQKAYEAERNRQGMDGAVAILKQQLATQRSSENQLKQINAKMSQMVQHQKRNTSEQRAQAATAANTPRPTSNDESRISTPPIDVRDRY